MSIKLTDTPFVMLSAAAQRDDRCLIASSNLEGSAAQKSANKLIAAGFVKEIEAEAGAPVWRRDDAARQSYALKLTAAGAKEIAIDESSDTVRADQDGDARPRQDDRFSAAATGHRPLSGVMEKPLPRDCS